MKQVRTGEATVGDGDIWSCEKAWVMCEMCKRGRGPGQPTGFTIRHMRGCT